MKRDTMERLVLLPFSHGCISESSVAIGHRVPHPRRAKPNINNNSNTSLTSTKEEEEEEEEESLWSLENNNMKNSSKSLAPSKSNGFHRLCRSFKTISQLFVYKEELEELASEMEIGVPTDVKHVTHIGLDGPANNINPIQSCFHGWDSLVSPHQMLSTPSPPLGQFDINMPAQFNPALVRTSSC